MPDKVEINHELGIIEIKSFGDISQADIETSIIKVLQIYNESGINRVLVDTSEQESMPKTMDIFETFSTFPRALRVALLIHKDQTTMDDIHFTETVAQNRGILIEVFFQEMKRLNGSKSELSFKHYHLII